VVFAYRQGVKPANHRLAEIAQTGNASVNNFRNHSGKTSEHVINPIYNSTHESPISGLQGFLSLGANNPYDNQPVRQQNIPGNSSALANFQSQRAPRGGGRKTKKSKAKRKIRKSKKPRRK
jgi:hypothetical protein